MNWGAKIVMAFVAFGVFIITLVVICVKQDFHLVSTDYYEKEIHYQEQIERIKNVGEKENAPLVNLNADHSSLEVIFPANVMVEEGELHLFRPSDARKDKKYALVIGTGKSKEINLTGFDKGLWRAKLTWKSEGREYFDESVIVI